MGKLRIATTMLLCLFSIKQLYTQTREYTTITSKREMRGVWVATVNNIDWPSQPGLSVNTLKHETDQIINRVKKMGLNTIFLQVRPSSDAIYKSDYEPFTSYVVNDNEKILNDFDPLEYWIQQAHCNGLEIHAWINPFRVTPKNDFICSPQHLSNTHNEWTITYAERLYLNPGIPEAREYVKTIVNDITSRYDIDGIHIDDYFYPYPVKDEPDFADSTTYRKYNNEHMTLADWRRQNVNTIIHEISTSIKQIKPWVAFGVSPFGVWRNKRDDERGSNTKAGITNYDILYADVVKWIDSCWVDYVVPQIYWEAGNKAADFDELSEWWANRSNNKTKIFVGHAIFKVNASNGAWENPNEMPSQIEKVRSNENLDGSVFFSYRQFNRDLLGLESMMQNSLYSNKSLSPLIIADGNNQDLKIKHLHISKGKLQWTVKDTANVRFYAIYRYIKGDDFDTNKSKYLYEIVDTNELQLKPSSQRTKFVYCVAAIDKFRKEHIISKRISIKH